MPVRITRTLTGWLSCDHFPRAQHPHTDQCCAVLSHHTTLSVSLPNHHLTASRSQIIILYASSSSRSPILLFDSLGVSSRFRCCPTRRIHTISVFAAMTFRDPINYRTSYSARVAAGKDLFGSPHHIQSRHLHKSHPHPPFRCSAPFLSLTTSSMRSNEL